MFTVNKSGMRRAAGSLAALSTAAAFFACSLEGRAQSAPPNDNLTNAQVIVGVSGSVQGTNLFATTQSSEPAPVKGTNAQSTIWYAWTAPATATMDFNTRNSTDSQGQTLDTMLAVYRLKSSATSLTVANLTQITGNEDDPSGGVTSRVDFRAALGTTYYIQIGSLTNASDGSSQGYPVLNWSQSLVGGGFGFSTSLYFMSSLENWLPNNDGTINSSIATGVPTLMSSSTLNCSNEIWGQGQPNARITVTRSAGFTGRCEVTLAVSPFFYTNTWTSNYLITNLLVTNYNTNGVKSTNNITSFTNIYMTNIASVLDIATGLDTSQSLNIDEEIYATNADEPSAAPLPTSRT